MSCQYYCNPCSPCCTPCYPPCCTLCYFPYLVCCNPCCPIKTCAPCPPKKTPKISDFSNAGPPDAGKNREVKKKETKNVKGKESKEREKKEKGPKKPAGKNPARKGSPVAKKDTPEAEPKPGAVEKNEGEVKYKNKNDKIIPPTDSGRPPSPSPGVPQTDTGGKERPVTTGAVPDTTKDELKGPDKGLESIGAGDAGSPRKVICKCFAKGGSCTPKPPCECTLKPPPICTPNLINTWTLKPPHICTAKPPHVSTPKLCGKCLAKLQGIPPLQARQIGAAQMHPGSRRVMSPFTAGTPTISSYTPNMQTPRTAPPMEKGRRSPGPCVCKQKTHKSPFAEGGFYTCTVPSSSTQRSKKICEMFADSGDGLKVDKRAQKYVPQQKVTPPLQNQFNPWGGYRKLPFAGDGLSIGTSKCTKCANKQANVSTLPLGYNRRQPGSSQVYQNSSYTKPTSKYTRSICGTCGSVKFKPKVPVVPKTPEDCCFKGCFEID